MDINSTSWLVFGLFLRAGAALAVSRDLVAAARSARKAYPASIVTVSDRPITALKARVVRTPPNANAPGRMARGFTLNRTARQYRARLLKWGEQNKFRTGELASDPLESEAPLWRIGNRVLDRLERARSLRPNRAQHRAAFRAPQTACGPRAVQP